jgi:hypothetical protein
MSKRSTRLSTGKKVLFVSITLLLALAAVFLVTEVALRALLPQTLNVYEYDTDFVFKFRPHSTIDYTSNEFSQVTTFNSQGFKDYEYNYAQKPAGTFRALVLGDSFAVGLEVPLDKTLPKQLEQKLRAQFPEKNIEVLSVATNGWSTEQELLFLEKKALAYQPDLVILAYFVGNDQIDNAARNLFTYDGKQLAINRDRPLAQSRLRGAYYFLSAHSHAFNFFQKLYWDARAHTGTSTGVNYDAAIVPYLQQNLSEGTAFTWKKTFALLNRIDKLLYAKNIPLIIAVIPDRVQEIPALRKERGLNDDDLVIDHPQQLLYAYGRINVIPVVDLLPAFQRHADAPLHFAKDFHWNEAGHALAAEQLVKPTASFIN